MATDNENKNDNLTERYVRDYYDEGLRSNEENYTYGRWFASKVRQFDYEQTKLAFLKAFGDGRYEKVLEIGPGDGVWTSLVATRIKNLTLLDQSEEMLKRAKETLKDHSHIKYQKDNAADFKVDEYFDMVMSMRCLEYVTDKKPVVEKIYQSLNPGGKFILITKNPNYRSQNPWRRPLLHTEQAGKIEWKKMMEEAGFAVEAIYPAVYRWKSAFAPMRFIFGLLHKIAVYSRGKIVIPWLTDMATESYTYVAIKPPLRVEMYGLTGSGKTSTGKELEAMDSTVKRFRPRRVGRGFVYYFFRHPLLVSFWLKEFFWNALARNDWRMFRYRLSILLGTFESLSYSERERTGLVLVDEGLFQRVASIYERKCNQDELTPLIKSIPKPDVLLVIERNDDYFRRYRTHAEHPRNKLGEAYMKDWKEMVIHNYHVIIEVAEKIKVPIIRFGPETNVTELLNKLKTI